MMIKNKPKANCCTANISKLSHEGRGIAQIEGKTHFIANALPNEVVSAYITHKKARYNEAVAMDIITPAANRIPAHCPHFNICGGCSLQHISNEEQVAFKQRIVLEQLQHIAGLNPEAVALPISDKSWGYRHKARLGVKYDKRKHRVLIGFRERINPRFIADIESCAILPPYLSAQLPALKAMLLQLSQPDKIPQIEVAIGQHTTALIIRHLTPLTASDEASLNQYAQNTKFHLYLQPKGIDSIHRLWPTEDSELLSYVLSQQQVELFFHPTDFTQINAYVNPKMVSQAIDWLALDATDQCLDLFCGLGNFSLPLATACKYVHAVEGNPIAVQRGEYNAQHNNLTNIQFYSADLTQSQSQSTWLQASCNKLLIDPPRSGAIEMIHQLAAKCFDAILYVSCNPATLARDSVELTENQNYTLKKIGIIDMFPHTSHVETMALFTPK